MKLEKYISTEGLANISGLFVAEGDFGVIDGDMPTRVSAFDGATVYECEGLGVRLRAEFREYENGVVIRSDTLENISGREITVNRLSSRFVLDGDSFDVYTQFSSWQNESRGAWQRLNTIISAESGGIRSCDYAAPVMAFKNGYTGKKTVFHLLPNAMWNMTARRANKSDREITVFECGFRNTGLRLRVERGETVKLPEVIFFGAESEFDLDEWRLHTVYNRLYPRRSLPVAYNSWLYCFDDLDMDALMREADTAADMGFEAFMIDAGWFGSGGNWSAEVGDWEENMRTRTSGRLSELSERVRERGMVFGLWFEPERAEAASKARAEHPDEYFREKFLDFANPAARERILSVLSSQIEKYKIGWIKLDFNATTPTDPEGGAFYRYSEGQRIFIRSLRERFPELYISGCAGGGYRMELAEGRFFDSFWLSDCQSPVEGVRIVRDTLKRMPTCLIERWNVQKWCEGFPVYQEPMRGRMIHTADATWDGLVGVKDSFSEEFVKGGLMGFSCGISDFPNEYKKRWAEVIAEYKAERDFYISATARILAEGDGLTVIEYASPLLDKIVIQAFATVSRVRELWIYPAVDPRKIYLTDGEKISGAQILENGIRLSAVPNYGCAVLRLEAD